MFGMLSFPFFKIPAADPIRRLTRVCSRYFEKGMP